MGTVKLNALEKCNMLPKDCCIYEISSLVTGGAVSGGVGSWDATPYLLGSVGYGAY